MPDRNPVQLEDFHFVGIGGVGMSALALLLLEKGKKVSGSDLHMSGYAKLLAQKGARVCLGHAGTNLENPQCVIYSTAVDTTCPEIMQALQSKARLIHRAELLAAMLEGSLPLLAAGSHGKTTTSALLATVLQEAGLDPSYAVGGKILGYGVNAKSGAGKYFVAESDESDGSFLKLPCFGAIITNIEDDHLNYWKSKQRLDAGFLEFIGNVASLEHLFWCHEDATLRKMAPQGASYGFDHSCDLYAENIRTQGFETVFDVVSKDERYDGVRLPLSGRHNVLNALGVFGMALKIGIGAKAIRSAFLSFRGISRRMEPKGEANAISVYDDYAHHPTEIRAALLALKEAMGGRRIIALFQPHRYTRTADFFKEFSAAFGSADEVVITDIYAASEKPIEGVSGELLAKNTPGAIYAPREELVNRVALMLRPHDVVLTIGAGDITHAGDLVLAACRELKPRLKVGVIRGGMSSEHEVSLVSAGFVHSMLSAELYQTKDFVIDKTGCWSSGKERGEPISGAILEELLLCDVCLPILHGPNGEDGMVQGFLKTLGIAHGGPDFQACALCMNKGWLKDVCASGGIPIVPYAKLRRSDERQVKMEFPLFVKPVHLGSSVGISRVENNAELHSALDLAFSLDDEVIVESEVRGKREIEFALLGNEKASVSMPGEVLCGGEFYSYERKYGAAAIQTTVTPDLPSEKIAEGRKLAAQAYELARCSGFARVDFFLDADGNYFLNEINPIPGLTKISLFPQMWAHAGLEGTRLIDRIIILALEQKRLCKIKI